MSGSVPRAAFRPPTGAEPIGIETTGIETTGIETTGIETTGVPTGVDPTGVTSMRPVPARRIDGIEVRLRRLVDSAEPAVVFSSLVRLCVPTFSDACSVDIVEGGRVRYRISYPPEVAGSTTTGSTTPNSTTTSWKTTGSTTPNVMALAPEGTVVTEFESDLPGWTSFYGVMTSSWHTRRATRQDESRAALIVDHAIRLIRSERLADPMRTGSGRAPLTGQLRGQRRAR